MTVCAKCRSVILAPPVVVRVQSGPDVAVNRLCGDCANGLADWLRSGPPSWPQLDPPAAAAAAAGA